MILKPCSTVSRIGRAADVEEVGRHAAVQLDDVHGGHRETGTVDHAADIAVELDVVQIRLGGFNFGRIFFGEIAHPSNVRMADECVVVEIQLGIERDHATVAGDDQRIDLRPGWHPVAS